MRSHSIEKVGSTMLPVEGLYKSDQPDARNIMYDKRTRDIIE